MDSLLNVIGLISLVGGICVAIGQGLVIVGFPTLLLIGLVDGQKGGRLGGSED